MRKKIWLSNIIPLWSILLQVINNVLLCKLVQSMMLTFLINLPGLCHRWECPIPPFPGRSLSCQGIGTDTTIHPSVRPLYMYIYNKETTLYNKSRSVILRKIILNGQQRITCEKNYELEKFRHLTQLYNVCILFE